MDSSHQPEECTAAFSHVSMCYGSVEVLCDVSFTLLPNAVTAVIGPSGCGKSTLLNLLAGHLFPTTGTVNHENQLVTGPSPDRGMVFQGSTLFPWLTLAANIGVGSRMRQRSLEERGKVTRQMLGEFGLAEFANHYPHQLSGGMAQRGEIVRAIANQPKLLMLDEPFGSLDMITRRKLQIWFLDYVRKAKPTCLMSTHSVAEAVLLAKRIIILSSRPGIVRHVFEIPDFAAEDSSIRSPEFRNIENTIEHALAEADKSA